MAGKTEGKIFFLSISIIVVLIVFYTFNDEQVKDDYSAKVEQFREEKDEMFRNGEDSPLTRSQKKDFAGLTYFPVSPAFRIIADYEKLNVKETIDLPTSTGEVRTFQKYAVAKFQLNNKPRELVILRQNGRMGQLLGNEALFLAFTDATSGVETYEAGRYLNIEPEDGQVLLDFNMAYNPYCNYNYTYECPIPLRENYLDMEILAGEKKFVGEEN